MNRMTLKKAVTAVALGACIFNARPSEACIATATAAMGYAAAGSIVSAMASIVARPSWWDAAFPVFVLLNVCGKDAEGEK